MKVQSVTLRQPLTGEVGSYYAAIRGYEIETDNEHLGGGVWVRKDGKVVGFVPSSNVAGHGPQVVCPVHGERDPEDWDEAMRAASAVEARVREEKGVTFSAKRAVRPPTKKTEADSQDLGTDK